MKLGAKLAGAATAGLTGAVTGGIGSIISSGLGLLGGLFKNNNNGLKNQKELMQQAWEYEKEGMGLQYSYGQQAADAEYKRNLQMWKETNFVDFVYIQRLLLVAHSLCGHSSCDHFVIEVFYLFFDLS